MSGDILDENGEVVARLSFNEWQVNKDHVLDRNFDDSTFEVIDASGDVVLQLELIDDCLQIQFKIYSPFGCHNAEFPDLDRLPWSSAEPPGQRRENAGRMRHVLRPRPQPR